MFELEQETVSGCVWLMDDLTKTLMMKEMEKEKKKR